MLTFSVSNLTNLTFPSSSCAAASNSGAINRHGPHHEAYASITKGKSQSCSIISSSSLVTDVATLEVDAVDFVEDREVVVPTNDKFLEVEDAGFHFDKC